MSMPILTATSPAGSTITGARLAVLDRVARNSGRLSQV